MVNTGKPTEYRLTGIPPSKPLLIGSLNMHYSDVTRYSSKAAFEVFLLEYRVANQLYHITWFDCCE